MVQMTCFSILCLDFEKWNCYGVLGEYWMVIQNWLDFPFLHLKLFLFECLVGL